MKTEITILLTGVSVAAGICAQIIWNNKNKAVAMKCEEIRQSVRAKRSEADQLVFDEKEVVDKYIAAMNDAESIKLDNVMAEYDKSTGYNSKISSIVKEMNGAVDDCKKTFGIEGKLDVIRKEESDAIETFKKSVNYDKSISEYENKILEAENQYETQKTFLKLSGDNEINKTAKDAAKSLKKKIVKENNNKIEELKEKLDEAIEDARKVRVGKETELNRALSNEVEKIEKTFESKINDLKDSRRKFKTTQFDVIKDQRSEDDLGMIARSETLKKKVEDILKNDNVVADKIIRDYDARVALGEYLAKEGYSRWFVGTVFVVPIVILWFFFLHIIAGLMDGTARYFFGVRAILSGMKKAAVA